MGASRGRAIPSIPRAHGALFTLEAGISNPRRTRYNGSMLKRSLSLVAALCALSFSLVHAQDDTKPAAREAAKPQASVASKTAKFGTVKLGDGSVKLGDGSVTKALKATDLAGAKKLIGKEAAFEGTVATVYTPKGNGLLILNFDKNYRNALTAVLRSKNYAEFPDMQTLKGKHVLITGKFEDYKGSAELILTKPDQIKLITE